MWQWCLAVWQWLLDENNRGVIGVILTVIGLICGGIWKLYQSRLSTPPVSQNTVNQGAVIVTGGSTGDITVQQSVDVEKLAEELAKKLKAQQAPNSPPPTPQEQASTQSILEQLLASTDADITSRASGFALGGYWSSHSCFRSTRRHTGANPKATATSAGTN